MNEFIFIIKGPNPIGGRNDPYIILGVFEDMEAAKRACQRRVEDILKWTQERDYLKSIHRYLRPFKIYTRGVNRWMG